MSENKHTPEPWHLCEVENETGRIKHLVPVDAENMSLLTIVENDQATFAAIYNDDDARRITACVNRLAQFTTEQIEDFGYDLFAEDRPRLVEAQNEIHLLKKQRDELLAALEGMLFIDADNQRGNDDEDVCYEVRQARSTIASVKGQK